MLSENEPIEKKPLLASLKMLLSPFLNDPLGLTVVMRIGKKIVHSAILIMAFFLYLQSVFPVLTNENVNQNTCRICQ